MPTLPGVKLDNGKTQLYTLLIKYFPRALKEVCEVSTFGANKYCVAGWETVDNGYQRYTEALVRHIFDGREEPTDMDSGLLHDAHAAWNALARLELRLRGEPTDSDTLIDTNPSTQASSVKSSRGADFLTTSLPEAGRQLALGLTGN